MLFVGGGCNTSLFSRSISFALKTGVLKMCEESETWTMMTNNLNLLPCNNQTMIRSLSNIKAMLSMQAIGSQAQEKWRDITRLFANCKGGNFNIHIWA